MSRPRLFTRAFVVASLAHLCFGIAAFLFLHFPGFLSELGAGEAVIGRVMALSALSAMLTGPFIGRLLDVLGRRRVIIAGTALFAVSMGLYLTVESIGPWLYFVRIADGVGAIAVYAGLFTFASDHVPQLRRTEGLAIFGASGLLPMALSGQMGDLILRHAGYDVLFAASLAFAAAAFVLALGLHDTDAVKSRSEPSRGIRSALVQTDLMPVWFVAFAFFFSAVGVFTFIKTFVLTTGLGSVGGFFSAYSLVAIALRLTLGWVPDRVGPVRVLGPALLVYACGLAVLGAATDSVEVIGAGVLCGIGHGFTFPILFTLVVERVAGADRGSAMGIYTTIDWIGHLAGAPILGLAIESVGYGGTYVGLAAVLGAATVVFYVWDARVEGRTDWQREPVSPL